MNNGRLDPCIPLPITRRELEETVTKAKDWALMHGAGLRPKEGYDPDSMRFAPFTLLPTSFPRCEFERAVNIQPIMNELIHKVAYDYEFLASSLKSAIEGDEFTAKLFELYETINREGTAQAMSLGLLRSDYFPQTIEANVIKQVEVNTIAASLSGIATTVSELHRYVLSELDHSDKLANLPENTALQGLCKGMLDAWELYGQPSAVILFVVEPVTYNICDQRFHEFEIRKLNPSVKVIRRTFLQLAEEANLVGPQSNLIVGNHEIAVVYYRTGYVPTDYPSQAEWATRLLIERSHAIKCPTIQYQLAGTKKVQQSLARPNILEKFLKSPDKVEPVRQAFTGLYALDFDEFGDAAVEMALSEPERFVLKPQREGGGHNVYGSDVGKVLKAIKGSRERTGYILMDRILPPVQSNYMITPGRSRECFEPLDVISELGIYGVVIGDEHRILVNRQAGHMLRTKSATADEGGVAAGFGALDSPYLI